MKVIKFLDRRLEEVILVLLLSCIVVIMLCQIVCRYVLNDSLSWSEEFCPLLLYLVYVRCVFL